MAMYAALRRAAASALPLAARRVVTSSPPRTFHSALSVRLLLHSEIAPFVVPSLRFANFFATKTSADDNLIQVLESEISCALEEDHAQNQVNLSLLFIFVFSLSYAITFNPTFPSSVL